MKRLLCLCCLTIAAFATTPAVASAQGRDLKVTMSEGRVTIVARNVSLREVLQEWARVGKTTIVNAEKLAGPPVTLHLVNSTERDALDILLRSAAGYLAVPRAESNPGTSVYDRIAILATSRAPAATAMAMAAPPPAPIQSAVPNEALPAHGDYSAPAPSAAPGAAGAPAYAPPAAYVPPPAPESFEMPGEAGMQPPAPGPTAGAPFPGMVPHLEGAQPRDFDFNKMMGGLNKGKGTAAPATSATPGITIRPGGGGN